MGHVRESIQIDAPPEAAWRIGRDAHRIPEWNTTTVEVRDVSGPLDQVGARYTAISKIAGRPLTIEWHVDRVEPMRLAETSATAPGGGRATAIVQYEPAAGGTRMTVDLDYELPMGFLGEMFNKLIAERSVARDVRHSSENFKALVEEEATVAVR